MITGQERNELDEDADPQRVDGQNSAKEMGGGKLRDSVWVHSLVQARIAIKVLAKVWYAVVLAVLVVPAVLPVVFQLGISGISSGVEVKAASYDPVDVEGDAVKPTVELWRAEPSRLAFGPGDDARAMSLAERVCQELGVPLEKTRRLGDETEARPMAIGAEPLDAGVLFAGSAANETNEPFSVVYDAGAVRAGRDARPSPFYEDALGGNAMGSEEYALARGITLLQALASRAILADQGMSAKDSLAMQRRPDEAFALSASIASVAIPLMLTSALGQASLGQAMASMIHSKQRRSLMLHGQRPEAFHLGWFLVGIFRGAISVAVLTVSMFALGILDLANVPVYLFLLLAIVFILAQSAFQVLIMGILGRRATPPVVQTVNGLLSLILVGLAAASLVLLVNPGQLGLPFDKQPLGVLVPTFLLHNNAVVAGASALVQAQDRSDGQGLSSEEVGQVLLAVAMLLVDAALYLAIGISMDRRDLFGSMCGRPGASSNEGSNAEAAVECKGLVKTFRVRGKDLTPEGGEDEEEMQGEMVERRLANDEWLNTMFGFSPPHRMVPKSDVDKNGYWTKEARKAYKAKVRQDKKRITLRAVDNLNLSIHRNQIFCLLGQNGAGKTTAMSMLTGADRPASGEIWVDGKNVSRSPALLRKSVGLCPQHDVVLDFMTCIEQLVMYGRLHGLTSEEARRDGLALMERLGIGEKANKKPSTLSGGQRRRLSVCGAVIGAPPVIFLDEPTTGLDPKNRRAIWDLFRELRKQHTLVLTTHSMEEAEALGDRIAIMSKGTVQAEGTLRELRAEYGAWYRLTCTRTAGQQGLYDSAPLLSFLRKHAAGTTLLRSFGPKVSFRLPLDAGLKPFVPLFEELERTKASFGIDSFAVSPSTLDDIFLHLAKRARAEEEPAAAQAELAATVDGELVLDLTDEAEPEEDIRNPPRGSREDAFSLPTFECKMSRKRQALTLAGQVRRMTLRRPASLFMIMITPLFYTLLGTLLFLIPMPGVADLYAVRLVDMSATASPVPWAAPDDPSGAAAVLGRLAGEQLEPGSLPAALAQNGTFSSAPVGYEFSGPVDAASPLRLTIVYNPTLEFSSRAALQTAYAGLARNASLKEPSPTLVQFASKVTTASPQAVMNLHLPTLGIAVISCGIALDLARFRTTGFLKILWLTGMQQTTFWLIFLLIHSVYFFIGTSITLLLYIAFDFEAAVETNPGVFLLLFFFAAPAATLFAHVSSLPIKDVESGEQVLPPVILLSTMVAWALSAYAFQVPVPVFDNLATVILPPFGIYRILVTLQAATLNGTPVTFGAMFTFASGLPQIMLSYAGSIVLYGSILFCFGVDHPGMAQSCRRNRVDVTDDDIDIANKDLEPLDVEASMDAAALEANIRDVRSGVVPDPIAALPPAAEIPNGNTHELPLLASHVYKRFGDFQAVKDATFGTTPGTIFGLLGPNGAGKSTLANSISRLEGYGPTRGDAWVTGVSVVHELAAARQLLGVCPQFDAHLDMLTGRELLHDMCAIRGVPLGMVEVVVDRTLAQLSLTPKADARCGTYSGGNKRRLSIAMAMIGNPKMILLDEPTTGIDPATRQAIWDYLVESTEHTGRSIVLTTHSMEEADALCTRLAIMVAGSIRAAGSSQQLKERYGEGVVLSLTLKSSVPNHAEEALRIARTLHPKAELLQEDRHAVKLLLPSTEIKLARTFETLLNENSLDDFTVAQRSLEDIFVQLASLQ